MALLAVVLVLMVGTIALGIVELTRQADDEASRSAIQAAISRETREQSEFNERLLIALTRQEERNAKVLRIVLMKVGATRAEIAEVFRDGPSDAPPTAQPSPPTVTDGSPDRRTPRPSPKPAPKPKPRPEPSPPPSPTCLPVVGCVDPPG
jgi:hypothetical protein